MSSDDSIKFPDEFVQKWQHTLDAMARIFDTPGAVIARVVSGDYQVILAGKSSDPTDIPGTRAPLNPNSYCAYVALQGELLQIDNAHHLPQWNDPAKNRDLGKGVISYMGLPLMTDGNKVFGTICVADRRERHFSAPYVDMLWELKKSVEADFKVMQQQQQILEANDALRKTNQQLMATQQVAQQLREEAVRRNHEKSHFLATAVHDLRQPIQAISNALDPLSDAVSRQDEALTHMLIDLARDAAALMRRQLGAILEISRLESGYIRSDPKDIDVLGLVESVVKQLQPLGAKDGVSLRVVHVDTGATGGHTDPQFLSRMVGNIVGNGIKYFDPDKPGRKVEVRVGCKASRLRIEVEDNGIGIASEHLQTGAIFKPFFQSHNRRHEQDKGVGLGLSIVNAMLAVLPGHEVHVHSVVGEGTTFTLELPVALGAITIASTIVADEARLNQDINLRGKYILLVEDDQYVRITTSTLLARHGLLVESVASVEELDVLLVSLERVPDLVLSDHRLPDGMTALDVAKHVRDAFGSLPLVILTADTIGQQGASHAFGYRVLSKPVSPAELLDAIADELIGGRP